MIMVEPIEKKKEKTVVLEPIDTKETQEIPSPLFVSQPSSLLYVIPEEPKEQEPKEQEPKEQEPKEQEPKEQETKEEESKEPKEQEPKEENHPHQVHVENHSKKKKKNKHNR